MSLDNNRTAIIRNWKERWARNKDVKSAQKVEQAIGEYPDSKLYVSKSVEIEGTEDELIEYALINQIIY